MDGERLGEFGEQGINSTVDTLTRNTNTSRTQGITTNSDTYLIHHIISIITTQGITRNSDTLNVDVATLLDSVEKQIRALKKLVTTPSYRGIAYLLYKLGYAYPNLTKDTGGMGYWTRFVNTFERTGLIRQLSPEEKWQITPIRTRLLLKKGKPSWHAIRGDKNWERVRVYAPTEDFKAFLQHIFEVEKLAPPQWAVDVVNELKRYETTDSSAKFFKITRWIDTHINEIAVVYFRGIIQGERKYRANWQNIFDKVLRAGGDEAANYLVAACQKYLKVHHPNNP